MGPGEAEFARPALFMLSSSIPDPLITCHVQHLTQQGMGVLLSRGVGACTLILTTFFCLPNMHSGPQAQPPPLGNVVAVAPAITQLSAEGLSHDNAITHSFHPHSQPASQGGSPPPSCSALSPPSFIFLPSPTISISTCYSSNSSLTPLTPTALSHFYPSFTLFSTSAARFRETHKGQKQSWSQIGEVEAKGVKMRDEVKEEKQHEIV